MENSKWPKWRPRFSLKALLLLPLLVGIFFAIGQQTNKYGRDQVQAWLKKNETGSNGRVKYECPLVVSQSYLVTDSIGGQCIAVTNKTYYLWLFGPCFKLRDAKYFDKIDENNLLNDIAERRLR